VKVAGILNQPLCAAIAGLGHTDTLVIADAGLPIPPETERIDLALTRGIPSFLDVLRVVVGEMRVEEAIVAEELERSSPALVQAIRTLLGDVPVQAVPHAVFKELTRSARAVVRTGECTPYANVILRAGVIF